jgi:hypothetical protein
MRLCGADQKNKANTRYAAGHDPSCLVLALATPHVPPSQQICLAQSPLLNGTASPSGHSHGLLPHSWGTRTCAGLPLSDGTDLCHTFRAFGKQA